MGINCRIAPLFGIPRMKSAKPKPPFRLDCTGFGPCVKVRPKEYVPFGCVFWPSLKFRTRQSTPAFMLCDPRECEMLPRVVHVFLGWYCTKESLVFEIPPMSAMEPSMNWSTD